MTNDRPHTMDEKRKRDAALNLADFKVDDIASAPGDQLLAEKGYLGALSYEAPNPAAWARDPTEVAREALAATRALLP